jgi:CRP-like cAMP-binding protein
MVAVLEVDPELGAGLDAEDRRHARYEALAPLVQAEVGEWAWTPAESDLSSHLGLLVLDGLLTRTEHIAELHHYHYTEFLGAGDVLRPWISSRHESQSSWQVLTPARIAVLDPDFTLRISRWPEIPAALLDRAIGRSRSLGATLAIHRAVRVQDRVQLMLWHLANRWGHVTPAGTVLPIPLTHEALTRLIGARRSPVTVALRDLERRGLVQRGSDRSWLLREGPRSGASGHLDCGEA